MPSATKSRAEVWQKLPAMHAAEFGNTANNLFACEMDAGNYPQVERILAAMDDYLVRNPGESAVKAYDQAAPGTYQAILMDLMMPVMDGYAAIPRHPQFRPPRCGDHPHHCHECQRLCRGCAEMPGHRHERPHQQAAV